MPRDYDDDRPRRRPRDDDEHDDRPQPKRRSLDDLDDGRPRPRKKKLKPDFSKLGAASLIVGAFALAWSFCCFGGLAVIPSGIGLVLGVYGWTTAVQSRGRQHPALPIAGTVLCAVALVAALIAMTSLFRQFRNFKQGWDDAHAEIQKEQIERNLQFAKAADEVKAGGNVQRGYVRDVRPELQ